jgi:hypothetical protein
MIDRDLKMLAIQIVTQLPEDKAQAKRVLALMNDLLENWIHNGDVAPSRPSIVPVDGALPGQILNLVNRIRE